MCGKCEYGFHVAISTERHAITHSKLRALPPFDIGKLVAAKASGVLWSIEALVASAIIKFALFSSVSFQFRGEQGCQGIRNPQTSM